MLLLPPLVPLVPLVPDDPPASSPLRWQAASDATNTGRASNAIQRWYGLVIMVMSFAM